MHFFSQLQKQLRLNTRGYILLPFALFFGYLCIYFTLISVSVHTALSRNESEATMFTGWISTIGARLGWSIDIAFALVCFVVFVYLAANISIIFYRNTKRYTSHGAAHFLTNPKELQTANLTGKGDIRLWLGQFGGQKVGLSYEQQKGNIVLVGDPYTSAKNIIVPAIANSETGLRSFLLVDTDGQIQKQAEHIRNWFTWYIFDVHQPSFYYNPLSYIRTVEEATDFSVCWLTNTQGVNDHLSAMHLLLTSVILHLVQTNPQTPPLVRLAELLSMTPLTLRTLLWQSTSEDAKTIAGTFFNAYQSDTEVALVLAELNTRFLLLHNKKIQHITTQPTTIHFSVFSQQPCALVINWHQDDQQKYKPLTACLVMQLAQVMKKQSPQFPFAFYLPMMQVGYIPHLPELIASDATAWVMEIDYINQIRNYYGEEDGRLIRDQIATHVVFRGTRDGKWYSALCGAKTVLKPSTRRSDRRSFWRRLIEGPYLVERPEALLSAEEIQFMSPDEMLIIRRDTPPLRARKLS